MYNHTLDRGRKIFFCRYCLQAFGILKIALKLMVSKGLGCLRKVNMLDLKILKER